MTAPYGKCQVIDIFRLTLCSDLNNTDQYYLFAIPSRDYYVLVIAAAFR